MIASADTDLFVGLMEKGEDLFGAQVYGSIVLSPLGMSSSVADHDRPPIIAAAPIGK